MSGKKFSCDNSCPRFKECDICAHTIAVAFKEGKLKELSEEYHITLSQMVLIPGSSGKKELFESEEAQTNGTVSTTRSLPIW